MEVTAHPRGYFKLLNFRAITLIINPKQFWLVKFINKRKNT